MGCGDTWTRLGTWLERSTCCPAALPARMQRWGGNTWPKPGRVWIHQRGDPTDAGARPQGHKLQLGMSFGTRNEFWDLGTLVGCSQARLVLGTGGRVKSILEKGVLVGWHQSHHPNDGDSDRAITLVPP